MRHGQGFDLVLQDWLRLVAQPDSGRSEPAPGFARYETQFDYDTADLLDAPQGGVAPVDMLPMLARLATQMHLGALRVAPDGDMPAGYTYLAQFAVHDLVNSAGFRTTRDRNLPRRLFGNIQSPALDLASLYGGGPSGSPAFFEATDETEHRARFRLGWLRDGTGRPTRQDDIPRIPLGPATGEAADDRRFDPLLADTRNADNLILSQLVVLFMKAHNRLHDIAHARAVAGDAHHRLFARPFEAARCLLTSAYRRILRHDLLPRLIPASQLDRAFAPGAVPHPSVSLESAMAVLRFGHALVQPDYDFNRLHGATGAAGPAGIGRLMDFFGMRPNPEMPVDDTWVIDWSLFFDPAPGGTPNPRMNRARQLGPTLAEPLRSHVSTRIVPPPSVPGLARFRLGLAFRTLAKGQMARLPTAQAVAREMLAAGLIDASDVMDSVTLAVAMRAGRTVACTAGQCPSDADIEHFSRRTPLFWYVLAEAEHFGKGAQLGPIGATLLADTFAMALADPGFGGESSLDAAADTLWQELFPAGPALPATMPDLVAFATGGTG